MIDPRDIAGLLKPSIGQILTIAEAAMPPSQFKPFKRLVLNELGRNGLEAKLVDFIAKHQD